MDNSVTFSPISFKESSQFPVWRDIWIMELNLPCMNMRGEYPLGFVSRAISMFKNLDNNNILHCPSGSVKGPGITVDLKNDQGQCPQIIANAEELPFEDNRFDLILSDPPYDEETSKLFGTPKYILKKAMHEGWRVLRPGGYYGLLYRACPYINPEQWQIMAIIAVDTGMGQPLRTFTIIKAIKNRLPNQKA